MRRHRSRGQALVEFALVVPLFLAMLFAIIDVGRVIWASNTLANAAREATRFAIVHGGSNIIHDDPAVPFCPVGPAGGDLTVVPNPSATCPYPSPSTEAIKNVARAFTVGGGDVIVTVCYGRECEGDDHADDGTGTNARGNPVTVVVYSRISLFTGALLGMPDFDVRGSSTMLVNN